MSVTANRDVGCNPSGGEVSSDQGAFCAYPTQATPRPTLSQCAPTAPECPAQAIEQPGLITPNPIIPALGTRWLEEVDLQSSGAHPLSLVRRYSSDRGWWHNHQARLVFIPEPASPAPGSPPPCAWPAGGTPCYFNGEPTPATTVSVLLGDGSAIDFYQYNPQRSATVPWTPLTPGGTLQLEGGNFIYRTLEGRRYEFGPAPTSTSVGTEVALRRITEPNGWSLSYTYDALGRVQQVTNHFGRSLSLSYDANARLQSAALQGGDSVSLQYGSNTAGNLITEALYTDANRRSYHYELANAPTLLSGISVNGVRYATYGYDAQGRANHSEHAQGTQRFDVTYQGANRADPVTITDPLGTSRNYSYSVRSGSVIVASASAPSGYGSNEAQARVQNGLGLVQSETDFLGNVTNYQWDYTRRLPTRVVRAAGSAQEHNSHTQWHPRYRLATRVAEPGRISTYVYNGQPDPFSNNALASCAPAAALLPDGQPIAVLCKQVVQATLDANGAAGFGASLDPNTLARSWSYTYNADGQVLSETDPANRSTTYTYYSDTTADHTRGDLQSVRNALGHTTQYTRYNPMGRLLQSVDPNGVATTYTWDTRQRLSAVSTATQSVALSYNAAGLLQRVSWSDGSTLDYGWDAAQRLTSVRDQAGNTLSYTLDNAGNRTASSITDASGALRRQIARLYDALGREQKITGMP